jgi:8-amino-7-oxononanoate synthase
MLPADLGADLVALESKGLKRRRRVIAGAQNAHIVVDGREVVAFCSNDYLGLASDPRLVAAATEGAARYGVGAGASHLITGHMSAHHSLEQALAQFVGLPRALLFSTGYMANIGVVTALVGRDDAVFADRLNHASLNDAALLSRAQFKRYAHGDLGALEQLLAATPARRKLVVTDAVFSMDGDIARVPQLVALCDRYDAWLMLDDAHGFGVLGATGGGALQHFGVGSPRIIYMATLGKAGGVCGAFVAGESDLVETLVQRARTYIYTTATPPLLAHALLESLTIIASESWRRDRLEQLIRQFTDGVKSTRWKLLPSNTPIQALIIGGNEQTLHVSAALSAMGIEVPAIRPPTVAPGTARLRVSLSAAHSEADVAKLVDALRAVQS